MTIDETDEWYQVWDDDDCLIAQFVDLDDARAYASLKAEVTE